MSHTHKSHSGFLPLYFITNRLVLDIDDMNIDVGTWMIKVNCPYEDQLHLGYD